MSVAPSNPHCLSDSACCNHMTTNIQLLSSTTHVSSLPPIHTSNGSKMNVTHTGHASTFYLSLPETYYIPNLALHLISVGQLCKVGLHFNFSPFGCQVENLQTGQILGKGRRVGRLFELESHLSHPLLCAATTMDSSTHQWPLRLSHASASKVQPLISCGLLGSTKFESFNCLNCQLAKQPTSSFNNSSSISDSAFGLIRSDI